MSNAKASGTCALCERERPLTFHHFIPRRCHRNKWFKKTFTREQMSGGIDICRDCHGAIHRFIPDHKRLAREYHSRELLMSHEQLAAFIAWVRRRDPAGRVKTKRMRT